jgi:hypothetical protein
MQQKTHDIAATSFRQLKIPMATPVSLSKMSGMARWLLSLTAFGILAVAAVLLMTSFRRMPEGGGAKMQDERERDLNQIRSACASNDLDKLKKATAEIARKARQSKDPAYVDHLRTACDAVSQCNLPDVETTRAMITELARLALQKADQTQLDTQLYLLTTYLRAALTPARLAKPEWPEQRKDSAALWLDVWRRVEGSIDPNWDPNDPKFAVKPFVPPPEIPFKSGMRPEDVKDPKARADYEAHIKKNAEITARNNEQRKLRKLKQEYFPQVVDYVAALYSAPPFRAEELRGLLAPLGGSDLNRAILAKVK